MAGPKIAVTGIKPTGPPHVGNHLGMIRPALALARTHHAMYFIADGHALTTTPRPDELQRLVFEVAATLLACGLDPSEQVLYRQSDVPEVFELAWILSCVTPKGLLNRAHAYKAAVASNEAGGRGSDDGVSAGLYGYPVLMAADVLLFGADVVPVGADQVQHVEIARDIAESFNRTYGPTLVVPEALVDPEVAIIPGLDGRKMSKSHGNTIPIFAPPDEVRRRVMRIVTDSRRPEEPKDPEHDTLFALYRHLAPPERVESLRRRYLEGGVGYAGLKEELAALIEATYAPMRSRYERLIADHAHLEDVLRAGAERAGGMARPMIERVRRAVGLSRAL